MSRSAREKKNPPAEIKFPASEAHLINEYQLVFDETILERGIPFPWLQFHFSAWHVAFKAY